MPTKISLERFIEKWLITYLAILSVILSIYIDWFYIIDINNFFNFITSVIAIISIELGFFGGFNWHFGYITDRNQF